MANPTPARTAAILTLGCKLNLADSEAMARQLRSAGWTIVERPTPADAVIVNTCSVTHVAEAKSRHLVRLARRVAPDATVAITGCLLETADPEAIGALGAGRVVRQPDQAALAAGLIAMLPSTRPAEIELRPTLRTRAFVSAQEGCNDVCAFCIVPKTRGRERSKSIDDVVAEVRAREAEGVQEVVITGTQLGAWGRDWGRRSPRPLLEALLRRTSVARIRMSSLQPQDLTPGLIELWQDPRLCRHFHLALQSGSAAVLARMRRRYTKDGYRGAVERLRAAIPDVAITTDVIVGFPGETEAEFQESYDFCREIAFAAIHVFPYSERRGTLAAKMPDQVQAPVRKERVHRLSALAHEMGAAYRERFLGRTEAVLWESRRAGPGGDSVWDGLTDTYVRVRTCDERDLANRLTPVRLESLEADGLEGRVLVA